MRVIKERNTGKMVVVLYHIFMTTAGILLFAAGIADIKRKQIDRKFIILLMWVCVAAAFCKGNFSIIDAACGIAVGLCAIGLSFASREQIGRGDGIVIAILGIVLGGRKCLAAVSMASFIMCIAAIIILILRKGNRHTKLAFLPALFAGYVLCMI